ncbi:MAG: IS110 family transposase [Anaerolineales bacterium]|nr:IS110 family transposase [Anaerolineales bacterium]
MSKKYFVGIDIASQTFTACVLQEPWQVILAPREFPNQPSGFDQFLAWLRAQGLAWAETVFCMEATGVYGEELAYFLVAQGCWLAVHPPLEIKRAFYPVGHKNDRVDSRQIAEYAARYTDRLRPWQPKEELLQQIQALLQLREQYVREKTAHQNALRALHRKVVRTPLAEELHQDSIQQLQNNIRAIEEEIRRLIDNDPNLHQNLLLLLTIPGVGLLLAAQTLVLMARLQDPCNPRVMAAFIGISPYEKASGATVFQPATSRHFGPASMRKLLHLAARSVRTHQPTFRQYFERKIAAGKPKALVLNNIANKMLKIMCAVIREQQPYIPNYRSVHPQVLNLALTKS